MGFELRDWRALAIGWAAALTVAILFGVTWWVPGTALSVAMAIWWFWR